MTVLNFYKIGKIIPDNAVYIGRKNTALNLPQSPWANPFPITKNMERGQSLPLYENYLRNKLTSGALKVKDLLALEGKDLVCYCAPLACHGNILEKIIAELKANPDHTVAPESAPTTKSPTPHVFTGKFARPAKSGTAGSPPPVLRIKP